MEAEGPQTRHLPHIAQGVFPVLSAALFIAMGYIDTGKWAACIDSGARFGGDLAFFLFFFNLVAIVCHYLSIHIGVVTGKTLSQIYSTEYDQFNRICLGIQAEVSIIMSDLAMILGIANGLHMILRVNLFAAVILAALDAVLYPLLSALLVNSKAKGLVVHIAGVIFVCYVLGLVIGLPDISISPIGMPSKLSGDHVYALISLLGANIMPHNFYLHSSIAQRFQGSPGEARAQRVHENFFSIFAIFSSIFLVNYVLLNSASTVFYSSGIVLSTFKDAMSVMEQSLWSPMRPLGFLLLISSSHIRGLSWGINREDRQAILYDFFGIDIPGWLHCATVRIFAIFPALYCLWHSGAEGMYQMLISTQIMVGLMLPASVVALYRIASSRALMGGYKISTVIEFFIMMSLMSIIGLQLIFLGEMVFGESNWLGYLHWNMGTTGTSSPHFILIASGWASICFTCHMFVTPLRSKRRTLYRRVSLAERQENDTEANSVLNEEQFHERPQTTLSPERVVETHSDAPAPNYGADLPHSTPTEEVTLGQAESVLNQSAASGESKVETADLVEETLRVNTEPATTKDGEVGESSEIEEVPKQVLVVAPAVGPEGLRSPTGRLDEGRNASGLGRTARRQMAAVLDEFWGHLYDLHGLLTQEAKANKLNLLLNADSNSKSPPSLAKADSVGKPMNSNLYEVQKVPPSPSPSLSSWNDTMQVMGAYQTLGDNALDNSERRYMSIRLLPNSEDMKSPATSNGNRFPSHRNQIDVFSDKYNQLGNQLTGSSTMAGRNKPLYPHLASRVAPPGFEKFGAANKTSLGVADAGLKSVDKIRESEGKLLQSLRDCILKLLKLEGSESLFKQTDGADEDLVERVAAHVKFFNESECKGTKLANPDEVQPSGDVAKPSSAAKCDVKSLASSIPHCGEGCVWKADLIVSFGVWCIHQILEISTVESRPELWGKYTYVLNRLQGVIDLAFFRQRIPKLPCICLQITTAYQQRLGASPPTARPRTSKFTTTSSLLDKIKDIEASLSSRKGPSGTIAGAIAFPKGKENLASVLKRYKRRLSNKPVGPNELPPSAPFAS